MELCTFHLLLAWRTHNHGRDYTGERFRGETNFVVKSTQKKTGKNFQKQGVDDLVMLPKVNEESVVENIKKRYMNDIIYTNIGPVLISVNPYKRLDIVDDSWVERYKGRFRHELDPHIYALAEETYRAMKGEKENQCVIIR